MSKTGYTLRVYGRESQHDTVHEAYEHALAISGSIEWARLYCNATHDLYFVCKCDRCEQYRRGEPTLQDLVTRIR